jgi:hypothetical protein
LESIGGKYPKILNEEKGLFLIYKKPFYYITNENSDFYCEFDYL